MSDILLTHEQGELAFDILEVCIKHFPESPEKVLPVLQLLLNAVKTEVEAAQ